MERAAIIDATCAALRSCAHDVVAAYLFGSVARGDDTPRSDVDVALLLRAPPRAGLAGLGFDAAFTLEQALHRPVDVVILNDASPDLIHRVLRDGILVLESDRRARVAFEVRARAVLRSRAIAKGVSIPRPGSPMTDKELAAKKLAEIETFLEELRTLGRPERVDADS